jgi:hypothetical protein
MSKITKHYPNWSEGFEDLTAEFGSTEELLEVPFVKSFRTHEGFSQFSIDGAYLMAEYHHGEEWWVVGRIEGVSEVQLPKWIFNREAKEIQEIADKHGFTWGGHWSKD